MNKEDIKKALKMCADLEYCDDCPYFNWENRSCSDELKLDALNLITEQEKENERLKAENDELQENIDLFIKEQNGDYEFEIKQAKIDVLNELKDKMFEREYMGVKYKERIFYESEIDDMIAEVQNAEDKS